MPLQRASMLRATRSPRRMCRALPRTVATCLTGSNVSPSFECHSTLPGATYVSVTCHIPYVHRFTNAPEGSISERTMISPAAPS